MLGPKKASSITNVPLTDSGGYRRALGRNYRPRSVGGGAAGFIEQYSELLISDPVTLDNGEYATHIVTTSSNNENAIIASVEWGVFVSPDANFTLGEALLPYLTGISSPTLTDWTIIGPYKSVLRTFDDADEGRTTGIGTDSERLTVINVSAGAAQTVYFVNKIKYIVNGGGGGA